MNELRDCLLSAGYVVTQRTLLNSRATAPALLPRTARPSYCPGLLSGNGCLILTRLDRCGGLRGQTFADEIIDVCFD